MRDANRNGEDLGTPVLRILVTVVLTLLLAALPAAASAGAAAEEQPAGADVAATAAANDAPEAAETAAWVPHGSFFTRWETRRNYDLGPGESSDYVRYRARLGMSNPALVRSGRLAAGVRASAQAGGFHGIGGDSLEQPELGLHEGVIELTSGAHLVQVGRFEMSYGEEVIIGSVGWHHLGRAFEGVRWRVRPDGAPHVDVFATTLTEGWRSEVPGTPLGAGDHYFTGVYAAFAPLLPGDLEIDAYALQRIRPATDPTADDEEEDAPERIEGAVEVTLGARLKASAGPADFRAEGGTQQGSRQGIVERRSVSAWHALAEVGVKPLPVLPRVAIQVFHASGDDPETGTDEAWQTPFATGHRWLGWTDIAGARSNIQGISGHLVHRPVDTLALNADVHRFIRPVGPEGDSAGFGTEVNAGAAWTLARGLVLRGAWGTFLPDSDSFGEDDDPRHFAEVELRLTF